MISHLQGGAPTANALCRDHRTSPTLARSHASATVDPPIRVDLSKNVLPAREDNVLGVHKDIVGKLPSILLTCPDHVLELAAACEPKAREEIETRQPLAVFCKRISDVTIALCALVLLFPILLAIALIVKAIEGGPVFLAHTRIGLHGRPFRCYKFRTMVRNADEHLRLLLAHDHLLAEQWRSECKLRRDPRVTRVGKILRKTSFDEVPQLINVLRGEMSCVGPRPVTAEEVARYGEAAADYITVRPGITGLWQVCGRSHRSYTERIALDRLYVHARSLRLDLAILLRTIPTVLRFDQTA